MKKLLKYFGILIGCSLVFLIITNPTNKDFESYLKAKSVYAPNQGRVNNYIIFSVYEYSGFTTIRHNHKQDESIRFYKAYYGVGKNFIQK